MTNDTMSISGILCRKAIVETNDSKYNIYFTEEIDIKSPNITTPYSFIDHVLSDFRVQLSMLKMQLRIKKYETTMVESSLFTVPDDYERVSREFMENTINSLFTKD